MKICLLIALFSVLFSSKQVSADAENDVKRGIFPFMAFLYYPDETVVDSTGARFLHGAIIIKPNWLMSSAIDHSVLDNIPLGFPRKTLLARAGAVTIDHNLTLNEDEDEQEREVINIIRPSIHNVEAWWLTDITLLKTLLPFNLTPAVAVTSIKPNRQVVDKNCIILVYSKRYGNASEDKTLIQLAVELLPPTMDNCGNQFSSTSMTCAVDGDETKHAVYDPEFCQGNSGGPLLCEGEVMALQTYIENNCKQPHLYQLLSAWNSLISCSIEDKCNQPNCENICYVIHKDNLKITSQTEHSTDASSAPASSTEPEAEPEELTEPKNTQTTESTIDVSDEPPETSRTAEPPAEQEIIIPEPTTTQTPSAQDPSTQEPSTQDTTPLMNKQTTLESIPSDTKIRSWPKEKLKESDTKEQEIRKDEKENWNANVEHRTRPKYPSAESTACVPQSMVLSICAMNFFF